MFRCGHNYLNYLAVAWLLLGLTGCGFLNQFRKSNAQMKKESGAFDPDHTPPSEPSSVFLELVTQPTSAVQGVPFFRYPKVRAVNQDGSTAAEYALVCTIAASGGIGTGTTEVSGTGTIEFDQFEITGDAGEYYVTIQCGKLGEVRSDPFTIYPRFGGGDGSVAAPYLIGNLYQLQALAYEWSDYSGKYLQLSADFDAAETSSWHGGLGFRPIGEDASAPWSGHFDGGRQVIRNLHINRPSRDYVGLFGALSGGTTIQNVVLVNLAVTGANFVGGLAGQVGSANTVSESMVSGTVSGQVYVGGMLGCEQGGGSYSHIIVDVAVTGYTQVGGVVGCVTTAANFSGIAAKVRVTTVNGKSGGFMGRAQAPFSASMLNLAGYVTGGADYLGGFIGQDDASGATISNIQTHVAVRSAVASGADAYAGGFAGSLASAVNGVLASGDVQTAGNYAGGFTAHLAANVTGAGAFNNVSGGAVVGGLVGHQASGAIVASFFSGDLLGPVATAGNVVGEIAGGSVSSSYFRMAHATPTITACEGTASSPVAAASCVSSSTGGAPAQEELGFGGGLVSGMTVSAADASSFKVSGWCSLASHGSSVTLAAVAGATVSGSATCTNGVWEASLNLSALPDGTDHITLTAALGGSTDSVVLSKDSQCAGKDTNAEFAGGTGTVGDPFLVCSAGQFDQMLSRFQDNGGYYFQLGNNINLAGRLLAPNVSDATCNTEVCDVIDGQGFALLSPRVITTLAGGSLFGNVRGTGQLFDLHVLDALVVGAAETGIVAGSVTSSANLSDLYSHGLVVGTGTSTGGLVASLSGGGAHTRLSSSAHVVGSATVGGVVGELSAGSLSQGIADGHVSGSGANIGGFVGAVLTIGTSLSSAKATAAVLGSASATNQGGFVGLVNAATVVDSYATGQVSSAGGVVGGFAGHVTAGGTVNTVYAFSNISAAGTIAGGLVGQLDTAGSGVNTSFMACEVVKALASSARLIGDMPSGSVSLLSTLPVPADGLPTTLAGTTDISAGILAETALTSFYDDAHGDNPEQFWAPPWSTNDDATDAYLPFLSMEE